MTGFTTTNPKNAKPLRNYEYLGDEAVKTLLADSKNAYQHWRRLSHDERAKPALALAELLAFDAARLGALATDEMGKPLAQAVKEVEKCATACRYYAEEAPKALAPELIPTEAKKSYVTFQPLGPVLCIMPWNFPYWQVIRFAIPALQAGNTVVLKHADNTTGVALELEALFRKAGFPEHAFRTLLLDHDRIGAVIGNPIIQAVSLTGSERAGQSVGAEAGRHLKKTVLELGGSDAYVVLKDADIAAAAKICVDARLTNNGQSCVAAKRFIIEAPVYQQFVDAFVAIARQKKVGDPVDPQVDVGPLAKKSILDGLTKQVQRSVELGAKALIGGAPSAGPGWFYPVTVLGGVVPGMPAFDEELFGPVAAMIKARDVGDALRLANSSCYGLGGAIFTKDVEAGEKLAAEYLEAGFVVVNGMVQSDARLPFGGIKKSGHGRELSHYGLREFVNVKTVVVH